MLSNFLVSQGSFVAKTSPTGSGILPTGSTAQRDGSPSSGYIRFNSDDTAFEGYNGSAWSAIGGSSTSGIVGVSTFTSSGTWTKSTRESALGVTIKRVIVEVQGAGGGGSTSANSEDVAGGSSGGYAKKLIDVSSISSATITIGSGGASVAGTGAAGNVNPGTSGGDSSWDDGTNTVTGGGATAHANQHDIGADPGTASGGDINISGRRGGTRYDRDDTGADSFFGWGGSGGSNPTPAPQNATGYGSGGGGANYYSSVSGSSGAGADGIVVVWEIAG